MSWFIPQLDVIEQAQHQILAETVRIRTNQEITMGKVDDAIARLASIVATAVEKLRAAEAAAKAAEDAAAAVVAGDAAEDAAQAAAAEDAASAQIGTVADALEAALAPVEVPVPPVVEPEFPPIA